MTFVWLLLSVLVTQSLSENPRTFCGRSLADARMLYCMAAEESAHKREAPDLLRENEMYQDKRGIFPFYHDDAIWPWLPSGRPAAHKLRSRTKREPGLVDECCLKPCYISELLSYC